MKKKKFTYLPDAKPIFLGVSLGLIFCALLLVIFSGVFLKSFLPTDNLIDAVVIFIAYMGAFFGGYISARNALDGGLKYGMISSFIMFAIIFLCGLILANESITILTLIRLLGMLFFGAIGGIFGINNKKRN